MVIGRLAGEAPGVLEILASGARTATAGTNGSTVYLPALAHAYGFVLDVTAAATDADDTLDVAIQTLVDGTNWVSVCAFTQCVGNGGAKRHLGKIDASLAQAMFEGSAALAAGSIRNWCGDAWRARYVIVDPTGSNASFTFSVQAMPM